MAIQLAEFSYALPVKMYPVDGTDNSHIDHNWAKRRLLSFQRQVTYPQRWQVGDRTPLQMKSTIAAEDLKIWDCNSVEIGAIEWVEKLSWEGYKVYECLLDFDAFADKTIYLYQKSELMDTKLEHISEAISVRTSWPNTKIFEYWGSNHVYDIFYQTGVRFKFRIEAALMDYEPKDESSDFVDELHDTTLLSSIPYDTFKLYIADAAGVSDWSVKLLNYIIHHRYWKFDGKQMAKISGEKWDIQREKNYPLVGASIGITYAVNQHSAQVSVNTIEPGVVAAYVLGVGFFGEEVDEITVKELKINY